MAIYGFIPVRGGSKSIPHKNIKLLNGKPLVYWMASAMAKCDKVDMVYISTDDDEIEAVVKKEIMTNKVAVFRRDPETATDTASTESAMIDFLKKQNFKADDLFILGQATSPLTESSDVDNIIDKYNTGLYDSLLTVVEDKRFYWKEDNNIATSINYDYMHRPRRQDFDGCLMENGALYLNSVGNILKTGNRLSGRIGTSIMPEYTSYEIDEPSDWEIIEQLKKIHTPKENHDTKIKVFLSDVDGVLTDGGMYYSDNGVESKKYNTRDGRAFSLLKEKGIKIGLITSENTKCVSNRAVKLKMDFLYLGVVDKKQAIDDICKKENIKYEEIAYIGDDINDKEVLQLVGKAFCPSDAMPEIKKIPNIMILSTKGGDGTIREIYNRELF